MQQRTFPICFIWMLISIQPSISINLCPNSSSCNCTLTNNIDLEISCNSILSPSQLPTLINNTLQTSVTSLRVDSSIAGTPGPLITLPLNICSSYPNIAILNLSSNAITGFLNTSELACLGSNLIQVDLSNNFINDIDKNFFQSNRKLQTIDLSHNNLITMPTIDGEHFVNFTSTIILMNFSFNHIINVDLWPLFVKTQNFMTIDMSNNLIQNYTNTVPVDVEQFTETPDPRNFYLNNNQIQRLSDILLEQYGACSTVSSTSTAYFIVGISNILLTNNPLICDCESYNLLTFINHHLDEFPLIANHFALITQANCTSPSSTTGQAYIFSNFTQGNTCENYTLPQISDGFCSVYTNESNSTLPPPTYWPSTTITTILTTIISENQTTIEPGGSGGGNGGGNNNSSNGNKSTSPAWYIILGIVLGLVLIIFLIVLGCFLCKDRLLPRKYRSKLGDNDNNLNRSYEPIIRHSELSSKTTFPLNGMKPRRASISTSTGGINDQDNRMMQFDDGTTSDHTSPNGHHSWDDKVHPEQETQTRFQIVRSKPSANKPRSTRDPQRITNNDNHPPANPNRKRKTSSSTSSSVATNTTNVIRGIPISSISTKIPATIPNGNDISISEVSVTSIPLTPSKRAKLLPPIKSGLYVDSRNNHLLNTSASAMITHQRQRRRSSVWTQRPNQNFITPPSIRPQSMITPKTIFNEDNSSDEERSSIPTVESLTTKSSKSLRALPLLNITVIPAWIDDYTNQT